MSAASRPTMSRRHNAGFWSSSRSFFLPVGPQIDAGGVVGYPIDLRVKAASPRGLEPLKRPGTLHVGATQFGLACYERWLAGDGEQWLAAALESARHLLSIQQPDGSWLHHEPFPHTFPLQVPWASAITQGQGASLLVRLSEQAGDDALADGARLALEPLFTPQSEGGLRGELGGLPWPEEYPTSPQSHVLNGAIFALWGVRDVAVALGDGRVRAELELGLESLVANLDRYDTGTWSLYSLFPHPIRNLASSFYHDLHINQLRATSRLLGRRGFELTADRWAAYAASRYARSKAFAGKAAFRVLVPRNRVFARAMPWTKG